MNYTSRIFIYVGMLIVLFTGMMLLSFKTATDIVVSGSREHLRHAAMRKQEAVRLQGEELLNYTDIIANDLRLQEYLYVIIRLGASSEALESYYNRQFGSLPTDAHVIISRDRGVLNGSEYRGLADALRQGKPVEGRTEFIFPSPDGPVLVAAQPIVYQGEVLATAAVARRMGDEWLQKQESQSEDYLVFFESDGRVLWSSNPDYRGFLIDRARKMVADSERSFYLHEVVLPAGGENIPRLWFAASETRLIHMLNRYRYWAYAFSFLGGLTVLLLGWLMVRNFRRPFEQLMETTEAMVHGRLPVLDRNESRTELGQLLNRFADVLDALRREKAKVKRAHKKLQETAITDSLTGMYNRRYLQEVTPGLFAQVERDGRYLTAILLDLDYFKSINDKHGHLGGDAVLVHFARLLKHNSRANDHLFRIGGEEFLILNVSENPDGNVALAEKIRELVSESPATYQGESIPISVSAGVSCCFGRSGDSSLSRLMRSADKALYEAKAGGRNRIVVHSSCEEASARSRARTRKQPLSIVTSTKKSS